jgi:hypothetical protein
MVQMDYVEPRIRPTGLGCPGPIHLLGRRFDMR